MHLFLTTRSSCSIAIVSTTNRAIHCHPSRINNRKTFNHRQANVGGAVVASGIFLGICTSTAVHYLASFESPAITDDFGHSQENLHPKEFRNVQLLKQKRLTADTSLLRFRLPQHAALNCSIPASVRIRALTTDCDDMYPFGRKIERSYSVVSLPSTQGHFDIIVKQYPSPEGDMSRFLHSLASNSTVELRGPVVGAEDGASRESGDVQLASPNLWHGKQKIGMLAGGSGVTPCISVLRYALEQNDLAAAGTKTCKQTSGKNVSSSDRTDSSIDKDKNYTCSSSMGDNGDDAEKGTLVGVAVPWQRKTQLSLVVSDRTAGDVIFNKELAKIKIQNSDIVSVYRTLTRSTPQKWEQGTGRMNKTMLRHLLPPPGAETVIFVSGPRGFVEHVAGPSGASALMSWTHTILSRNKRPIGGLLGELGYTSDMVQVL